MKLGIQSSNATQSFGMFRPTHILETRPSQHKTNSELGRVSDTLSVFVSAVLAGWDTTSPLSNSFIRTQQIQPHLLNVLNAKCSTRIDEHRNNRVEAGLNKAEATGDNEGVSSSLRVMNPFALPRTAHQLLNEGDAIVKAVLAASRAQGRQFWKALDPANTLLTDLLTESVKVQELDAQGNPIAPTAAANDEKKAKSRGKKQAKVVAGATPVASDDIYALTAHALVWMCDFRLTMDPAPRDNVRAKSKPLGDLTACLYRQDDLIRDLAMLDESALPFDAARGYGGIRITGLPTFEHAMGMEYCRRLTGRGGMYDHADPKWHADFDIHTIVTDAEKEGANAESASIAAASQPNVAKRCVESLPAAWTSALWRTVYRKAGNASLVARQAGVWFASQTITNIVESSMLCLQAMSETLSHESEVLHYLVEQERVGQYGKLIANLSRFFRTPSVLEDYQTTFCDPLYAETKFLPLTPGVYGDKITLPDTALAILPLLTIKDEAERYNQLTSYLDRLKTRHTSASIKRALATDQALLASDVLNPTLDYKLLNFEMIPVEDVLAAVDAKVVEAKVSMKPLGADINDRHQGSDTTVRLWLEDPIVRIDATFAKAYDTWGKARVLAVDEVDGRRELIFQVTDVQRQDAPFSFNAVAKQMHALVDRAESFHVWDPKGDGTRALWELEYLRDAHKFIHGLRTIPHLLNGADVHVDQMLPGLGLHWFTLGIDHRGMLCVPVHQEEADTTREVAVSSVLGTDVPFAYVPVDRLVTSVADTRYTHVRSYLARYLDMTKLRDVKDEDLLDHPLVMAEANLRRTAIRYTSRCEAWREDMVWSDTRALSSAELGKFVKAHIADPFFFFDATPEVKPLLASTEDVAANPYRLSNTFATPLVSEQMRDGQRFMSTIDSLAHLAPISAFEEVMSNFYIPSSQGSAGLFALLTFMFQKHDMLDETSMLSGAFIPEAHDVMKEIARQAIASYGNRVQDTDGVYLRSKIATLKAILNGEMDVDKAMRQGHSRITLAETLSMLVLTLMLPERMVLALMPQGQWAHVGRPVAGETADEHLGITEIHKQQYEAFDRHLYRNPLKGFDVVENHAQVVPLYRRKTTDGTSGVNTQEEGGFSASHLKTRTWIEAASAGLVTSVQDFDANITKLTQPHERLTYQLGQFLTLRDALSAYFVRITLTANVVIPRAVREEQARHAEAATRDGAEVKAEQHTSAFRSVDQAVVDIAKELVVGSGSVTPLERDE